MKKEWINIIDNCLGVEAININSKLVSAQNRPRLYWTNIKFNNIEDKNIKLIDILDKDFKFDMNCQYVWSDEEFKKLFEDCWSDSRKSLENELIDIFHSEDD